MKEREYLDDLLKRSMVFVYFCMIPVTSNHPESLNYAVILWCVMVLFIFGDTTVSLFQLSKHRGRGESVMKMKRLKTPGYLLYLPYTLLFAVSLYFILTYNDFVIVDKSLKVITILFWGIFLVDIVLNVQFANIILFGSTGVFYKKQRFKTMDYSGLTAIQFQDDCERVFLTYSEGKLFFLYFKNVSYTRGKPELKQFLKETTNWKLS